MGGKLRHRGPGSRPDGDSKAGAPKGDGTEQRWLRWGALSMAGIIALFLSLLMLRTNQTNRPETVLPMLAGGPAVAVWQWTPDRPFADKAVEYGRPIVFKNSVVTTWPAASRWSTKYLAHKMGPTLANVYQNNKSRHFGPYYDPVRPLAPLFPTPPGVYNDNATAPITKLLRVGTATVDGEGPWTYYSGELDRFGEWAFRDVEPYAELIRPMPERSSINLWIGTDGVTAHCHYDGSVFLPSFTLVQPLTSQHARHRVQVPQFLRPDSRPKEVYGTGPVAKQACSAVPILAPVPRSVPGQSQRPCHWSCCGDGDRTRTGRSDVLAASLLSPRCQSRVIRLS